MADKLAELIVEIQVKIDDLKKGLDQAEGEIKSAQTKLTTAGQSLAKAIPYAAIAAGVMMVGKKLKDVLSDAAEYGAEISRAMEKTGLSADLVQDIEYGAGIIGASFNSIVTAVGNMNKKIGEAASGKDSAVKLFEDLGTPIEDLLALNPDQRLMAVFEAIRKITDPTLKSAAAQNVFGTLGDDLIPLIDKMGEFTRTRAELNLGYTADEIKSLKDGEEAMKKIGEKWDDLKRKFAVVIWPSIQPFLDSLLDVLGALENIARFFDNLRQQASGNLFTNTLMNTIIGSTPWTAPFVNYGATTKSYNLSNQPAPVKQTVTPGNWESYLGYMGSSSAWSGAYGSYASGGIITEPTLAMLGESGDEAVIPLSGGGIGGVHNHFHIGNFLGDESALRAFVRRAKELIREDDRRTTYTPNLTEIYQVGGRV